MHQFWKVKGSSISFFKRKLVKVEHGLALVPETNIDKLVENFESHFGQVRVQHVACDASIKLPDVSSNLTSRDAMPIDLQLGVCFTWQETDQISCFASRSCQQRWLNQL